MYSPAIWCPAQCALQSAVGRIGLDNRAKWLGCPAEHRPEATPEPSVLDTELQEASEGLCGVRQGCDSEMKCFGAESCTSFVGNKKGRLLKSQPFSVYLGG